MLNGLKKIFGTKHTRAIKKLQVDVDKINSLEGEIKKLSDEELQAQTNKFKNYLEKNSDRPTTEVLNEIIHEAYATVREASVRVLGMRHFDVQMIGGLVLFKNIIAEMKTGEGKTLTATLPLYLHGLTGKGSHVVTVNDYLASRDCQEMGVLFNWLGLSTGVIVANMSDEERKEFLQCRYHLWHKQ